MLWRLCCDGAHKANVRVIQQPEDERRKRGRGEACGQTVLSNEKTA